MQYRVTIDAIIPYLETIKVLSNCRVLEIGCAEAGVLKAFIDQGCYGVGIELSESRVRTASNILSNEISEGKARIINKNVYDINPTEDFGELFDIVVLKDVIEHIPNQELFISELKKFIKEDGIVFFAYPPWWMPFGGHQQICASKILRILPWFHLLPMKLYTSFLKLWGESAGTIKELVEIKQTGITIERLRKIIQSNSYKIIKETYWLINPIYTLKFGFRAIKLPSALNKISYFRNLYTTAHYIVFKQ